MLGDLFLRLGDFFGLWCMAAHICNESTQNVHSANGGIKDQHKMAEEKKHTFVIHDESLNSYGFYMVTAGAEIKQFKKNPIMLWNHNRPSSWRGSTNDVLPIGHWENIRIEGTQIFADAVFDSDDFSQKIAKKVEEGTLRMASVGARIITESTDTKYIKPGQRYATVLKWKLREASIVDIGANDNALALYDKKGGEIELSDNAETIPLTEITKSNIETMDIETLQILNLQEGASDQAVRTAVQSLIDQNAQLTSEKSDLDKQLTTVKGQLKVFTDKEKEQRTTEAATLTDAAVTDGRLDAKQKDRVLKMFEGDHDGTKAFLADLPIRTPVKERIGDGDETFAEGGAWEKRMEEIRNNK